MLETIKSHFTLAEAKSILITWIGIITGDVILTGDLHQFVSGNWNKPLIITLLLSLFRSLVKAIWMVIEKSLQNGQTN